MARTTSELLAQLERFLPTQYGALRPVLAGIAAMLHEVEGVGDALVMETEHAQAAGQWLTLLARSYGLYRTPGEDDDSLRERLRYPDELVTRPAILAAVNRLLALYTVEQATMVEPWDEGFADVDAWADSTTICDAHNSFVLVCPLVGTAVWGDAYADTDFADTDAYAGSDGEHPVYATIVTLVERVRAAGIRWWLVIDNA